jgi:hypothetical protein
MASGIKHKAKKVVRLARTAGIAAIHCLRHSSNYCLPGAKSRGVALRSEGLQKRSRGGQLEGEKLGSQDIESRTTLI